MVRIHKSTYEQIYNHLKKCNESFKPKLSSYVNLKEYSEKIYKKAILFEYFENEKLVGLIAGYPLTESFYITNVSTDPDFSGRGIGKTLLERQNAKLLFKDDKNLGGASVVISWSPKNILL